MIPVYYLEEIRCAYISEATYNKHKNEIDAFLNKNLSNIRNVFSVDLLGN